MAPLISPSWGSVRRCMVLHRCLCRALFDTRCVTALDSHPVWYCRHEALLLLLRQDIWVALAMAACRPSLAALSHSCQVCSLRQFGQIPT